MHKIFKVLCLSGRIAEAVQILFSSRSSPPISPSSYSLLLQETIHQKQFNLGKLIHTHITATGFPPNEYLIIKLLILNAKAGDFDAARQLFDQMPHPNLLAHNALISGLAHGGLEHQALQVYYALRAEGLNPDQFTFSSAFRACAKLASLDDGRRAHCLMIKMQDTPNLVAGSALVSMYSECGGLADARQAFDGMHQTNVVTWTALISGYGRHGNAGEVVELFRRMVEKGFRPNSVTFLALLSACSHGGLVNAGWRFFASMIEDYRVRPKREHYAAMVDMMGRAGRLREAYEFIGNSVCGSHSVAWGALMGACKVHGDVELAKVAACKFFKLQPGNVGKYVVLCNALAASEMWEKSADVWGRIGRLGIRKEPAQSSVRSWSENAGFRC